MWPPGNLFPEGQGKPSIEGARFDSPDRRVCKSRLVDRYFPDERTGFISLQLDTFNFIGPDRQEVCIDTIDKCLHIS